MSLVARRAGRLLGALLATATLLTACGGDDTTVGTTAPVPSSTDFETYAQQLTSRYSCDSNPEVPINTIDFSFATDQDTADARSTDEITAACQS